MILMGALVVSIPHCMAYFGGLPEAARKWRHFDLKSEERERLRRVLATPTLVAICSEAGFLSIYSAMTIRELLPILEDNPLLGPMWTILIAILCLVWMIGPIAISAMPDELLTLGCFEVGGGVQCWNVICLEASKPGWLPLPAIGLLGGLGVLIADDGSGLGLLIPCLLLLLAPLLVPFIGVTKWLMIRSRVRQLKRATGVEVSITSEVGEGRSSRCPVCGDNVQESITRCADCRTPHHRDCFEYNTKCGLYGCQGQAGAS